jgi:hypothetical protein
MWSAKCTMQHIITEIFGSCKPMTDGETAGCANVVKKERKKERKKVRKNHQSIADRMQNKIKIRERIRHIAPLQYVNGVI